MAGHKSAKLGPEPSASKEEIGRLLHYRNLEWISEQQVA